jgi:hypothetical protein
MKKFSTSLRILSLGLLLGTLAVLSACSGGSSGGSGGGDTPAPPPAPTLKAWQGAALIETDNAGDALEPKVSFDASGNAMAVWLQSDGSRSNVMARRYTASTTQWSTVTLVDTLDTDASAPEVAMDASGNAIVVWSQPELVSAASSGDIWVRHYTASSKTWSDAMLLETISGLADQVNIATDVSGNAMAVWVQLDASGVKNIWSRYFNRSTGTWATTQLVEIVDSSDASDPRIAFSSAGKAMVVW